VLAYDTEKSKVVGFINAISDRVHFAFIPMLEVLPEYRHRGIGSNLVKTMLKRLEDITCIDLMCDTDMHPKQTPSFFQIKSFHQHHSNPCKYSLVFFASTF
jgi:N-acetylglutamate synthase-like GNAT family acetyltransferase